MQNLRAAIIAVVNVSSCYCSRKTLNASEKFSSMTAARPSVDRTPTRRIVTGYLLFEKRCDGSRLTENRRFLIPGDLPETMRSHTPDDFQKSCPLKNTSIDLLEIVHIVRKGMSRLERPLTTVTQSRFDKYVRLSYPGN